MAPLLALSAAAGARESIDIQALAEQAGLSERQVRMVLGNPTSYAEYRTSYFIAYRRVMDVLGDENFRENLARTERIPPPEERVVINDDE
jgi:transcriptional antiterminator